MPELEAIQAAISKAGHTWTAIDPPQGRPYSLGWEPSPQPLIDRSTVMADQLKVLRLPALLPHVAGDLAAAMPLGAPPHPPEFDWRTRGVVGAVTDQENCGSCVSFATAGLVSTQAGIELGTRDLDLSETDQHFNSAHGASCGGWNNASSLAEVQVRGISLEFDFAYDSAFDNPTQFGGDGLNIAHSRPEPLRNVNAYKVSGVQSWTGDDRKYYLSTVGPLIRSAASKCLRTSTTMVAASTVTSRETSGAGTPCSSLVTPTPTVRGSAGNRGATGSADPAGRMVPVLAISSSATASATSITNQCLVAQA